ncbi:MAG: hypothetical protein R3F20_16975 [Planctomycetota bacterium]
MTKPNSGRNEPAAVVFVGDLLNEVLPQVARFPESLRFGLGSRIE